MVAHQQRQQPCAYCGLPVAGRFAEREAAVGAVEPAYCCFGCRFAASVANADTPQDARRTLTRLGLAIFFTMNVMVFTMALWSWQIYDVSAGGATHSADALQELLRYAALAFSAPVILLLGGSLAHDALRQLRRGHLTSDLLLLMGVLAAYAYSVTSLVRGDRHVYFEVSCMVLVAVTLGRWLEATGKLRTTAALRSLEKLMPRRVRKIVDGVEREVDLEAVDEGDLLRVLPGERVGADGIIESNQATIDEQLITGESRHPVKGQGQTVYGGTMNMDGDLYVRVSDSGPHGTLSRLIQSVRDAAAVRAPEQRLADRIAGWFVPAIWLVALATFAAHATSSDWQSAIMASLAVLLIACPCALGVATPMAVWAALGRASRGQVVFRDGSAVTRLARLRSLCVDKTGTLTTGKPRLLAWHLDSATTRDEMLRVALALAEGSPHPLCHSVRESAPVAGVPVRVENRRLFSGRGTEGDLPSVGRAWLGSPVLMRRARLVFPAALHRAQKLAVERDQCCLCVGWAGKVRGLFVFEEALRAEAIRAVAAITELGLTVTVLSGDHAVRTESVARSLGVPARAELLPEEKQRVIEQMSRHEGPVGMVGDGVNDAPALAAADLGIAMGCGADLSRDAADVCLLGDDLERLPWAVALARRTRRTIWQNLAWAFAYNVVGIPLAAAGFLNPMLAAVAMVASSLFVISNSLRLVRLPEPPRQLPTALDIRSDDQAQNVAEEFEQPETRQTLATTAG